MGRHIHVCTRQYTTTNEQHVSTTTVAPPAGMRLRVTPPGVMFQNLHKLEVRGRGAESVVTTQEEEDASMTAAVDDTSHQRLVTEKDSPELEYVPRVNQRSSHLVPGLSCPCQLGRNIVQSEEGVSVHPLKSIYNQFL